MIQSKKRLLLGAHMSISGGFTKAIERGLSINCSVIQIFTKSNRQWRAKTITKTEAEEFKTTVKESGIHSITAHASYLINVGSPNKETVKKSIDALIVELQRSEQLGIQYLVLHPGSHLKSGEDVCIEQIAHNIDIALKKSPGKTMLLLETMAGQGSAVGYKFEHLTAIRKMSSQKKRIGVCFDTCHAFAAGYQFGTPKQYQKMWAKFDATVGLKHLKVIHLNDSKKECGSKVDRHQDIGKGKLGPAPFKLLFNDPRFFDIPKILETPKEEPADDARNMQTIIGLLSKETKKILNV